MSHKRFRLALPIVLSLALTLGCRQLPLPARTPLPGPGTVLAGATATATATPAPSGKPLPRLAAGEALTMTTINMLDETAGWGIGHGTSDPHDHVLRPSDGGSTWQDVSPPAGPAASEAEL